MAATFSRSIEAEKAGYVPKAPRYTSPISFFGMSVYRLVLLVLFVLTVPTLTEANLVNSCVTNYDPMIDYFPNKIKVDRAGNFAVEYFKHYKVVTNSKTEEEAVLYQCGTPQPTGFANTTKIFQVPVQRVGFTSTTEVTFLEILGVQSAIKYSDSLEFVTSPCIQSRVTANDIEPFSANSTIKLQQVDTLDVIFVFSKTPTEPKYMSVSSSGDSSPLGRAEWIDFLSLFFNREAEAETAFNLTKTKYDCFSTEFIKSSSSSPKVAWVDFYSWSASPYVISNAKYKVQYIRDVGATPIAPDQGIFDQVEKWKEAVRDVDIIIDETYNGNMEIFLKNFNLTMNDDFKFLKNQQVWRVDRLQNSFGALDWFESALPEADSVIQDIGSIVKPEVVFEHQRIWFRNSAKGEDIFVEGSDKCTSTDGPRNPRDEVCEFDIPNSSAQIFPGVLLLFSVLIVYLLF